jgi:hypothetical protein
MIYFIQGENMSKEFKEKALKYLENYKLKRPCVGCNQMLHSSQLDPVDGTNVDAIIKGITDKETYEKSKLKIAQLLFICANCNRLKKFKESR